MSMFDSERGDSDERIKYTFSKHGSGQAFGGERMQGQLPTPILPYVTSLLPTLLLSLTLINTPFLTTRFCSSQHFSKESGKKKWTSLLRLRYVVEGAISSRRLDRGKEPKVYDLCKRGYISTLTQTPLPLSHKQKYQSYSRIQQL